MKRALLLLLSLACLVSVAGCVPPPPPDQGYHDTTVNVNHNCNREVHHPKPPRQPQHVEHPRPPQQRHHVDPQNPPKPAAPHDKGKYTDQRHYR